MPAVQPRRDRATHAIKSQIKPVSAATGVPAFLTKFANRPARTLITRFDRELSMSPDAVLSIDAMTLVRSHGDHAVEFATAQADSFSDLRLQARWVLIRRRIVQIMEAAAKDAL